MLCPTCGGSGNLLASTRPLKFETCFTCWGRSQLDIAGITQDGTPVTETCIPSATTAFQEGILEWIKFDDVNRTLAFRPKGLKTGQTFTAKRENDNDKFAHLAVRLGWFKSVSEASRAGWNVPAQGSHTVGKRTIVAQD